MKLPRRKFLHLAAAVIALTAAIAFSFPNGAWPQSARTIKIIVPLAPGGAASVLTQLVADEMSRTPGVTTVIENRPGAGTIIGVDAAARAAPDGNTLLLTNNAVLIHPH